MRDEKYIKMVSIVHNNVVRDTRVLKQAESLGRHFGQKYTVLGLGKLDEEPLIKREFYDIERIDLGPGIGSLVKGKILKFFKSKPLIILTLVLYYFLSINIIKLIQSFAFSEWIITTTFLYTVYLVLRLFNGRARSFFLTKEGLVKDYVYHTLASIAKGLYKVLTIRVYYDLFESKILELKPDILHAHDLPMLAVAVRIKKKMPEIKIIYDSHEIYEHVSSSDFFHKMYFTSLTKKCAKHVDGMTTVNESFVEYFLKKYKSLPRAEIVYNSILKRKILSKNFLKEKSPLRKKIENIAQGKKILLYQGGITEARGIHLIVEAFLQINKDWVFVIMGWGAFESNIRDLIRKLNLKDRVLFLPGAPLEDLSIWTAGADIGIIPYLNTCLNHWYCTPNKIWEYPAAGVPFIAPSYPELERVIDKFDIGWKLKKMSVENIVQTINSIDSEDIAIKSNNAFSYINKHNWNSDEEKLIGVYKGVLQQGSY